MRTTTFGFIAPEVGITETELQACPHRGNWGWDSYNGVLFHKCFDCGATWALATTDEGRLYWERVVEEGEAHGNRLGIVAEDVQPVSGDQEQQRVRKKSKSTGRQGQPVQDLPPPLELDLPAEEG